MRTAYHATERQWLEGIIFAGLCANPDYTDVDSELVAQLARDRAQTFLETREGKQP